MTDSDDFIPLCGDEKACTVEERGRKDEVFKNVARKSLGCARSKAAVVPKLQEMLRVTVMKRAVLNHENRTAEDLTRDPEDDGL